MTIAEVLWRVFVLASYAGLVLFFVKIGFSMTSRQWEIYRGRRAFGPDIYKVVGNMRTIVRRGLMVGAAMFALVFVLAILESVPCLRALYRDNPDYESYCTKGD
jgi:hypothetical protein